MERITDYVSVRDNGKIRPFGASWLDSPNMTWSEYWDFWGKQIANRWSYKGLSYQVNFLELGYEWVDLLFDETGLLAFPDVYCSPEAKILNGDLIVRCTMHPAFNVRSLSDGELEEVYKAKIKHYGHSEAVPHFKQQVRANRNRTDGIIEIEGNDGITDCMFFFDSQTGALVGAEPFPWAD